nr:hypothetical protein [Tanacetum cinerariifolium]
MIRMVYTGDNGQEVFRTCRIRDEMGLDVGLFERCSLVYSHQRSSSEAVPQVDLMQHFWEGYFFRHAEGMKSGVRLSVGHFIGRLAHHFGWQQVATTRAPEATEDDLAVDEGAQADLAPVQAPLPPLPPLAAGRTMS